MRVYAEKSLFDCEFWAGGLDTFNALLPHELQEVENILDDLFPDGLSETELNDLFWFDCDTIAEWLGFESFDEILDRNKGGAKE